MKVDNVPDLGAYRNEETMLYSFLCSYPEDNMVQIRRHKHYEIHKRLLVGDFGKMFDALGSECQDVIKEAEPCLVDR